MDKNIMMPDIESEDEELEEVNLRPQTLSEYIGQSKVKHENLY